MYGVFTAVDYSGVDSVTAVLQRYSVTALQCYSGVDSVDSCVDSGVAAVVTVVLTVVLTAVDYSGVDSVAAVDYSGRL